MRKNVRAGAKRAILTHDSHAPPESPFKAEARVHPRTLMRRFGGDLESLEGCGISPSKLAVREKKSESVKFFEAEFSSSFQNLRRLG